MSRQPDPIVAGLARGWRVSRGSQGLPEQLDCDVAIVGSGAGAGITAELLAKAGLRVVIVEEGPLKSSSDFRQRESEAYATLYQESAGRKTADRAITILQGRCVGGSTTVNWTSSFRTPEPTLAWWREHFGLSDCTPQALAPWFEQAERRLNIQPWLVPPNENNDLLRRGGQALGYATAAIRRNVNACWNLGSCGLGCPTNAKQSMLLTTLPAALELGAQLLVETQAQRLEIAAGRVRALWCRPVRQDGSLIEAPPTRITARHYVVAGGAINSPGLLLRSDAPDPHGLLGRRTFLHPTVVSVATFTQRVEGWAGAPQTIYSDHFLHTQPIDGPIGFKLEAPPLHPVLGATTLVGFGADYTALLGQFAHMHAQVALLRDGFHPQSPGGRVVLGSAGAPVLDYPLTDFVLEGVRRALLAMAEIQFAAGATRVLPVHEQAVPYRQWVLARDEIAKLPMRPLLARVFSAHVMGGCGFAGDASRGVVRPDGVHWQVENLSVHDGSIFPTSIGANPQLSIYGIVNRLATQLARRLAGRDVALS
jgi:choline dehydrogenase-like flavoprotein